MGINHPTEWLTFIRNQNLIQDCLADCSKQLKKKNGYPDKNEMYQLLHATTSPLTDETTRENLTTMINVTYTVPNHPSLPATFTSLPVIHHIINPNPLLPTSHLTLTCANKILPIFQSSTSGNLNQNILELLPLNHFKPIRTIQNNNQTND
jgi:hypothetical protein